MYSISVACYYLFPADSRKVYIFWQFKNNYTCWEIISPHVVWNCRDTSPLPSGSSCTLWGAPLGGHGEHLWENEWVRRAGRTLVQPQDLHTNHITRRQSYGPFRWRPGLQSHSQVKICCEEMFTASPSLPILHIFAAECNVIWCNLQRTAYAFVFIYNLFFFSVKQSLSSMKMNSSNFSLMRLRMWKTNCAVSGQVRWLFSSHHRQHQGFHA